jgi:tRNA1(Val) A37 N6-methylase TrmN6
MLPNRQVSDYTKTFQIPGVQATFLQHTHSQPISDDAYQLYLKAHRYIDTLGKAPYHILDIGCGNGIILLMLAKDFPHLSLCGIDILSDLIDIAHKNFHSLQASLNATLNYRLHIADYSKDIHQLHQMKFDIIVSNPPYNVSASSRISPIYERAIARTESSATQKDLLDTICRHLSPNAKAFISYPTHRHAEIIRNLHDTPLRIIEQTTYQNIIIYEITNA